MIGEIEYALMAGGSYISTRPETNQFPTPQGWVSFNHRALDTGFEAVSFTNGTEIVISFAGTKDALDVGDNQANIGLATGLGSEQLLQAAEYYLQVKAANLGATITFTGHSLGGGLAALMGIFFGVRAVTFDQAPFANTAEEGLLGSASYALDLKNYLISKGYSEATLADLTSFLQVQENIGGIPNSDLVTNICVQGEFLSTAPLTMFDRIGTTTDEILNSSGGVLGFDLHAQSLLTAFLQSDKTAADGKALNDVTFKLTDLLKIIFDDKMFYYDPNNKDNPQRNFLEHLVRHEAGVQGSFTADAMVTRFTSDLWKLAQDGGLTMSENFSYSNWNNVSKALIAFAMQKYYEENNPNVCYGTELFTDVRTTGAGSNGIQFYIADASKDIASAIANNAPVDLAKKDANGNYLLKGYQYFQNYLDTTGLLSPAERTLIKSLLPYMRDWYIQAGASGMNATDTLNRGAFMLGGSGSDAIVGGTAADLLVGNAGDDLLMGGQGNDYLLGGLGNDTYVYQSANTTIGYTGDGLDTILDSDGIGSIAVDGAILAGGDQYGDARVHKDANGHLYVDVGQDLAIDGNMLVLNYNPTTGTGMGLTMFGPVTDINPATTRDIYGDFTPDGSGNTDDLGNLLTNGIAAPGRADGLNDSVGNDHIISGSGDDLIYAFRGGGDIIEAGAGQDKVIDQGGRNVIMGGADGDILLGGTDNDRIYADTQITVADAIATGNIPNGGSGLKGDWLSGSAGDDTLIGSNAQDVLMGGAGSDLLIGGAGNDDIAGDGGYEAQNFTWTVYDTPTSRVFYASIGEWEASGGAADVIYSGEGNDHAWGGIGNDVIFGEGGDDILSGGEDNDIVLGGAGSDKLYGDMGSDYLDGGNEADELHGGRGDDILIGGAGIDTLDGGAGRDTYIFNRGDGPDWIYDGLGENNTLRFGVGISSNDITLNLGSLKLNLGNGDEIHIANFDRNDVFNSSAIGGFEFADGTTLTTSELLARGFDIDGTDGDDTRIVTTEIVLWDGVPVEMPVVNDKTLYGTNTTDRMNGLGGNDTLMGGAGDDTLNGGTGDDLLYGELGNDVVNGGEGNDNLDGGVGDDVLNGGAGNDLLQGGEGNDTYFFGRGSGQDIIADYDISGVNDTVRMGADVLPSDVIVTHDQANLYFTINNSDSTTDTLTLQNWLVDGAYRVENIVFANGTIWDLPILNSYAHPPTEGGDYLIGTNGNDVMYGLGGDDRLAGSDGNDILDGGTGNDNLWGSGTGIGAESDTYVFGRGYGQDSAYDVDAPGNIDKVLMKSGVMPGDVKVTRGYWDLHLSIDNPGGTTDTLTLMGWFVDDAHKIEQVVFADDPSTVWDVAALTAMVSASTAGADTLYGTTGDDILNGLGGNDVLVGLAGNDTLDGGAGDDSLFGDGFGASAGNDTYVFGRGYGHDRINDVDTTAGNIDKVLIKSGVMPEDVRVARFDPGYEDSLLLIINNPDGTSDMLTLENWYVDDAHKIEQVIFEDDPGTVWDVAALMQQAGIIYGTEGSDILFDTSGDDYIKGLSGNDWLYGSAGNDTLDGGAGNDYVNGGAGNDTYLFGRGSGLDDLFDPDGNIDTVRIAKGVLPSDVLVSSNQDDICLSISNSDGTVDKLTLKSWWLSDSNRIEQVIFADGTVWDAAALNAKANVPTEGSDTIHGAAGNDILNGLGGDDIIYGMDGNDTLDGGVGNDFMEGGAGNDTYLFGRSSGQDVVIDSDATLGNADKIQVATGVLPSDVVVSRDVYHLYLSINNPSGMSDRLTLKYWFLWDAYKVEQMVFANGTVWDTATLHSMANVPTQLADYVEGTAGNDVINGLGGGDSIFGWAGADALDGGVDDDFLYGGIGNDVLYGSDGNDQLLGQDDADMLNGGAGNDYLEGGSGDDILNGGMGNDSLLGGTGDDIYAIDDMDVNGAVDTVVEYQNEGIDTVQSSVEYTLFSNVENLTLTGTAAIKGFGNSLDNVLIGNSGNNMLYGFGGNDVLNGGAGADSMYGGMGDDIYIVDSSKDKATENLNEGSDTVQSSVTYTLGANLENLILAGTSSINGTGNSLNNVLTGNSAANTLSGGAGNDRLDGKAGTDKMSGGTGDDTYVVDVSTDAVTERANEGIDTIESSVTYTLKANVEVLLLAGSSAINGTDNTLSNLLSGNSAINTLTAGTGNDILQGGAGNDILKDTAGNNLLNGGVGADTLTGAPGNELFIGGADNDTITTGTGYDILAFNRGDGQDVIAVSTGADNTISLGGGIRNSDLSFRKSANDLILGIGADEQITLQGWYAATTNKSVLTLQMIEEASVDFNAASTDTLLNNKIEQFNFAGLAGRFDQVLAANPTFTSWSLANALLDFHIGESDVVALGGDLAYQYGMSGVLSGMNLAAAQNVINDPQFGQQAQTLHLSQGLRGGAVTL